METESACVIRFAFTNNRISTPHNKTKRHIMTKKSENKKSEMIHKDIPIQKLIPTNTENIRKSDIQKLRTSLEAIGMVESLQVYEEESGDVLIIEGNKRFQILAGAGHTTAPCILTQLPDTFTPSYYVIDVSPQERAKMIRKALEKASEDEVAAAIGVSSLESSIDKNLKDKLHPTVILAFKENMLSKAALKELSHVVEERQAAILKELRKIKNFGLDVIKAQIRMTSPAERRTDQKGNTPWKKNDAKRSTMLKRLEELENRKEMMVEQYHIYRSDVSAIVIFMRGFMENPEHPEIAKYVREKYRDIYDRLREILKRE